MTHFRQIVEERADDLVAWCERMARARFAVPHRMAFYVGTLKIYDGYKTVFWPVGVSEGDAPRYYVQANELDGKPNIGERCAFGQEVADELYRRGKVVDR